MPTFIDNVMVDAPATGQMVRLRQNAGEKFYRYLCLDEWLGETPDVDGLASFGVPNPSLSGQSGIIVGVSLIDDNFLKAGDAGVGTFTMYVMGNYNSWVRGREQRYTVLINTTLGQVRELVIYMSIV